MFCASKDFTLPAHKCLLSSLLTLPTLPRDKQHSTQRQNGHQLQNGLLSP